MSQESSGVREGAHPEREEEANLPLRLQAPVLVFDAREGSHFFDHCNHQLVSLTAAAIARTSARCAGRDARPVRRALTVPMEDYRMVSRMKFSLDQKWVALQRSQSSLEIMLTSAAVTQESPSYRKSRKGKIALVLTPRDPQAPILAFYWTHVDCLMLLTARALELYQQTSSGSLKLSKKCGVAPNSQIKWFHYSPQFQILAMCTLSDRLSLHVFYFKAGSFVHLPKVEVVEDVGPSAVCVARIYDDMYCIISKDSRLSLYRLSLEGVARTHTFAVAGGGSHAVHVMDNLLLVHSLSSKISFIFDLQDSTQFPVTGPLPLPSHIAGKPSFDCYSPHNMFLQPNYIVNLECGVVARVAINTPFIVASMPSKLKAVEFLCRRAHSQNHTIDLVRDSLHQHESIQTMSVVFDRLHAFWPSQDISPKQPPRSLRVRTTSAIMSQFLSDDEEGKGGSAGESEATGSANDAAKSSGSARDSMLRAELFHKAIRPVVDQPGYRYAEAVLLEYFRSMGRDTTFPEALWAEALVGLLMRHAQSFRLLQLLQADVVPPSLPVALQVMHAAPSAPGLEEYALGILKQHCLDNLSVLEYILKSGKTQAALTLSAVLDPRDIATSPVLSPAVFLEEAWKNGPVDFYHVYNALMARPGFAKLIPPALKSKYKHLFP